jgi:hypothetical protein
VTIDGVLIGDGFIVHLYTSLGTTSTYNNLHNSHITAAPAESFPACCVFTGCSQAMASNTGSSSASHAQVLSSQPPMQNSTLS